jgi:hypothetical protein
VFCRLNTINRALKVPDEISVRWMLFEYNGLELVILSKPSKTKELAEKARLKYPESRDKKIGIGVVRVTNS